MNRNGNRQKPSAKNIEFFHKVILDHSKVLKISIVGENLYEIARTVARTPIKVYVSDIYVVSEADVFEICSENGKLDCILVLGICNNYSNAAKQLAISKNIGLFTLKEFLGAINFTRQKFINYEPKANNNRNNRI